jgi:hypothetical protein
MNTNNSNKTTQGKTNNKNYNKRNTKKQRKMDQLMLFTLKYHLLNISADLQILFAAETLLDEGQWLKEQLNVLKLRMFRVGTRIIIIIITIINVKLSLRSEKVKYVHLQRIQKISY